MEDARMIVYVYDDHGEDLTEPMETTSREEVGIWAAQWIARGAYQVIVESTEGKK